MANQCVFCGTSENLNTDMAVKLEDGTKVTVYICDTHAEEATIKSAREAYLDKKRQLDDLLEKAKALGFTLQATSSGLVVAEGPKNTPAIAKQSIVQAQKDELTDDDPDVVDTKRIDSQNIRSVTGNVPGIAAYATHSTAGLQEKLPEGTLEGKVKMGVVEGRDGQFVPIPVKRVDGTGTTKVAVVKTGGDKTLQRRFREMAKNSLEDHGPDFARHGYEGGVSHGERLCPICKGAKIVRQAGQDTSCPKCAGAGIIIV